MAGRDRRDDRAKRRARDALIGLGSEIRLARLNHDPSQSVAAAAISKSASAWSRLERRAAPHLPLADLVRAAAVVGLELNVRAYPGGRPVRDHAHLRLLARLSAALPDGVGWCTEVPLPRSGDLRAWDALILLRYVRIGVEA
jgi:hypothetical protein